MAEIIPMTEEQKFQLEIYKLVMNQNAAAEEAFQFIVNRPGNPGD